MCSLCTSSLTYSSHSRLVFLEIFLLSSSEEFRSPCDGQKNCFSHFIFANAHFNSCLKIAGDQCLWHKPIHWNVETDSAKKLNASFKNTMKNSHRLKKTFYLIYFEIAHNCWYRSNSKSAAETMTLSKSGNLFIRR